MRETLRGVDAARLERSCSLRRDSIRVAQSGPGLELADVFLRTCAYEPHRHDSYAIGVTLTGVQTFRYRGARRICLPGRLHILNPDETHDGAAGTEDGFGYRILYVAPELIREALDGPGLPFVDDPVPRPGQATHRLVPLLMQIDDPISDLARVDITTAIADALRALSGRVCAPRSRLDTRSVELARDYLAAHACERAPSSKLEEITGVDRFTLARHFRRAFGTSPDRYRTMRRLALARQAIESNEPLAQVAARTGFADQSHLTRQFKRAYGLTPAKWAAVATAGTARAQRDR